MNILIHKRGDTIKWNCIYEDAENNPIDLTGYQIKTQARANSTSKKTLFDLSIGNGITITDSVNGLYDIDLQDTALFKTGEYVVDIQYTDNSNTIISTETFKLEIVKDITL